MKKIFGVFIAFIGLLFIAVGMYGWGNTEAKKRCEENHIQNEFIQPSYVNRENDSVIGGVVCFIGIIINIIGLVMIGTKTSKQRMLEAEYHILNNKKSVSVIANDDVISKIEQLGILKCKGLLSDIEFEEQKRKILSS